MKTSEDKLNEALRAALKRKFDHFEDEPDPSAFEKIRGNLKPIRQWKYLFFTLLFVSIAIVGVLTDQHYRKNNIVAAAVARPKVTQAEFAKTGVTKTEVVKLAVAKMTVARTEVSHHRLAKNDERIASLNPVSEHTSPNVSIDQAIESRRRFASTTVTEKGFKSGENSLNIEQSNITEDLATKKDSEISTEHTIRLAVNALDIQTVKFTTAPTSLPGIKVAKKDVKTVAKSGLSKVNLLLNASILQSYQILTVPSGAQSFQNFDFPSTFSLKALGYKFSVGAEKKGFQFLLHYSWFRQAYSYEIAGNDYIVETVDKDNFKVIRKGSRVSQDNKFRLLGVGINKEVTWGNANVGKYYASAGLQYSYGLIRRQSIGWVNAGIGKQFPISKNTSLHIGPYAEFSPVKFSGSMDPFYYQPYRVGISAGLRLSR